MYKTIDRAAQERLFFSAILQTVSERGLGRRPIQEVTTGDVAAMARACMAKLPKGRPPDTQPASGRPFVAQDPRVTKTAPVRPPGGLGVAGGHSETPTVSEAPQGALSALGRLRADPAACAVARLVAEGLTNREIGERLNLTLSQAKARVQAWFEATGLDGRTLLGVWVEAGGLDRTDARSAREAARTAPVGAADAKATPSPQTAPQAATGATEGFGGRR